MPDNDLTVEQATDIAKHFLGPEYIAWVVPFGAADPHTFFMGNRRTNATGFGSSWRECFRSCGIFIPRRPRYADVGTQILLGPEWIATAKSNSMAKRIAKALNHTPHSPPDRGQMYR